MCMVGLKGWIVLSNQVRVCAFVCVCVRLSLPTSSLSSLHHPDHPTTRSSLSSSPPHPSTVYRPQPIVTSIHHRHQYARPATGDRGWTKTTRKPCQLLPPSSSRTSCFCGTSRISINRSKSIGPVGCVVTIESIITIQHTFSYDG